LAFIRHYKVKKIDKGGVSLNRLAKNCPENSPCPLSQACGFPLLCPEEASTIISAPFGQANKKSFASKAGKPP